MTARLRRADPFLAVAGAICVVVALVIIWLARLSVGYDVYVSQLGATGAPTARLFEIALLLVVVGGSLVGVASRDIRSTVRWLALWTPAVSLWVASGFFLVASQVTCTPGCPIPWGASFDWQDLTHIVCAVLAFSAACWAMLQASFARGHRPLAVFSRASGIAVAVIAGGGGILSLAHVLTDLGARLELVATTIAILWVASYGIVIAVRGSKPSAVTVVEPAEPSEPAEVAREPELARAD
ncbi:MAG: hypothetical protein JWQ12_1114 [Glaciihabitans sp.]|nr:hypothetical protein [Glaciihabitans sp.]